MLAVDECGFLTTPLRKRTWARKGRTPEVRHNGSREKVTAVAGLGLMPSGRVTCVFRLLKKNATWADFFWWLVEVRKHYRRNLIVVWDNLPAHLKAQAAFERLGVRWVQFVRLPAYAPDLNPVECLWSDAKYHALSNWAAPDLGSLSARAAAELAGRKRRHGRLRSYFQGAGLEAAFD